MKELGIKEGKWIARANDYGVDVIEEQSGFGIIWFGTESELRDCEYPIELAEAHAILCADAGNTAQKCGLLPSELLQQRDELKEALMRLLQACDDEGWNNDGQDWEEQELARAAIKNTER